MLGDTCWCGLESRGTGLSAREAGGRVGKWRSGGARFLGCARAAEAGGELVIVSRKGVSRGGGAVRTRKLEAPEERVVLRTEQALKRPI